MACTSALSRRHLTNLQGTLNRTEALSRDNPRFRRMPMIGRRIHRRLRLTEASNRKDIAALAMSISRPFPKPEPHFHHRASFLSSASPVAVAQVILPSRGPLSELSCRTDNEVLLILGRRAGLVLVPASLRYAWH